jgi:RsbRD-like negative regulator of sigma factor
MIAVRLVRLIEQHSDELTDALLEKFQNSPRTSDLRKVPASELRSRSSEIIRNLSEWLLSKSDAEVERRYREIGGLRAAQGVSLADVCWGIFLTKEHIWNFLQREGFLRGALEIYGEMELLRLLDQFFDRAVCYCAEGYEQAMLNRTSAFPIDKRGQPAATA